jgi:curved DNA-binding protein CbpA
VKTLEVQNHYEILEVAPGARPEEIERAYRLASSTWSAGSLALYSLFDDTDAVVVRERIDQAYQVLSDRLARNAYDLVTFESPPEPQSQPVDSGPLPEALPPDAGYEQSYDDDMEISLDRALEGRVDGVAGEAGDDDYDGARMRRARMHRGLELADVGKITKVNLTYLKAIEDEVFDSLPVAVYVRGFVTAYARAIGLDPERVAKSFMPRFDAARKGSGRERLLGRR